MRTRCLTTARRLQMLTYHENRPGEDLRAHVHAFWTWRASIPAGEAFEHHVWPDGCVSLVMSRRSGAATSDAPTSDAATFDTDPSGPATACVAASGVVIGPSVEARCVPMSGDVVTRGVRFRPEAGAALLGIDATVLAAAGALPLSRLMEADEATALIDSVAGAAEDRSGLAQLEAWTRTRLGRAAPLDGVVTRAVDAIRLSHGQIVMAQLAASLALSPRQLQRRFLAAVGLTPKQYARIRRLRSLLAAVLAKDEAVWSALAAEAGYADQAHCARELSRLTGLPPRALAVRLRAIQHDGVDP